MCCFKIEMNKKLFVGQVALFLWVHILISVFWIFILIMRRGLRSK